MTFMRDEIFEQPDIVARLAADLAPYRDGGGRGAGGRRALRALRRARHQRQRRRVRQVPRHHPRRPAGRPRRPQLGHRLRHADRPARLPRGGHQPERRDARRGRVRRPRAPAGAYTVAITNDDDSLLARAGRHRARHARRPRARRSGDQDLHEPARRAGPVLGDVVRRRGAARRLASDVPEAMRAALSLDAAGRRDRPVAALQRAPAGDRPRLQLRHGARDGAQVQGDLVHRRHALLGRRPHARPHRHGRAGLPGAAVRPARPRRCRPCGSSSATCWRAAPSSWSSSRRARQGSDSGKRRGLRLPQAVPEPLSPLVGDRAGPAAGAAPGRRRAATTPTSRAG